MCNAILAHAVVSMLTRTMPFVRLQPAHTSLLLSLKPIDGSYRPVVLHRFTSTPLPPTMA